jgi:hypothetical protein
LPFHPLDPLAHSVPRKEDFGRQLCMAHASVLRKLRKNPLINLIKTHSIHACPSQQ